MQKSIIAIIFFMIMNSPSLEDSTEMKWSVPFFYVVHHSSDYSDSVPRDNHLPAFHELQTSLRQYREIMEGIIKKLSISHEVARRSEHILFPHHNHSCCCSQRSSVRSPTFFSCRLEEKITTTATLMEKNILALERLLKPFSVIVIDSDQVSKQPDISDPYTSLEPSKRHFTFPPAINDCNHLQTCPDHYLSQHNLAQYIPPYKLHSNQEYDSDEASYDSASHILTHLVRDWVASGKSIRSDTYDWILDQLIRVHESCDFKDISPPQDSSLCANFSSLSPVLVPGAGMARLAFDIAFVRRKRLNNTAPYYFPFAVEAVDNSVVMAAAAYHILHGDSSVIYQDQEIFPFIADPFSNEVDPQGRWQSEIFPEEIVSQQLHDLLTQQSSNSPSLSYTIGDFVKSFASPSKHSMYGSITTCFFMDTATNIYEYILTIRNLLRVGGVWINIGPVHWHRNAQLWPSVDELKDIITLSGFGILHWEVSDKLSAYRHPHDITYGTRSEAYRPLKFIVKLQYPQNPTQHSEALTRGEYVDLPEFIRKLHEVTGRRW